MKSILSPEALACPAWSLFYDGGMIMGSLLTGLTLIVIYLAFLRT